VGVILLIILDLLQFVTPKLMGTLTDALYKGTLNTPQLLSLTSIMVLSALLMLILRFFWRKLILGSSKHIETWLRGRFFNHLEKLSRTTYLKYKTGDFMNRATNDLSAVSQAFGMGIVMLTDSIFLTIFTLIIMTLEVDLRLTLLVIIPMPFLALTLFIFGSLIQKRYKTVQEAFSILSERVRETYSGIKIIKSFVQEKPFVQYFDEASQENLEAQVKLAKLFGLLFPLIVVISSVSSALALYFGGSLVIDGSITPGAFVSFIGYLGLLTWPIMAIGWVINVIERGMASLKRIIEILEIEPDITDGPQTLPLTSLNGTISCNDLTFSYPGSEVPTLNHVSFTLPQGKKLGIIGHTGCGKTTIMELIMRSYNVTNNSLYIGDNPIEQIPLSLLRRSIGYVPQSGVLFSRSIMRNIALSDMTMTPESIIHYSKIASLHEDVEDIQNGYETLLGEKGINLSGGQKQRLSIARALAKNPEILLLDDSFSAVDTQTEEKVLKQLFQEVADKTVVIASHRVSTLQFCDDIIVLKNGCIIQKGTHSELLEAEGYYKTLYTKQSLESHLVD
jgi:ATP-binding cassette subfamily B protein